MKVAAAVLLVLVVAYVVGASRTADSGDGAAPGEQEWLAWLAERIVPAFDFRDVPPGCFDRAAQRFVGGLIPCVSAIQPSRSKSKFRFLRLSSEQPGVVVAFAPAPGDDSGLPYRPVRLRESVRSTTVVVPRVGGTLSIACPPPGAPCVVSAR